MAQISCDNVSMSYEKKLVLKEISFDVNRGDYLCIVGENGSGKTTLMKGILGLMPIKAGSVIFGEDVKAKKIGYLPQQTVIQRDFPASVFEVILSGCLNTRGWKPFYSTLEKNRVMGNMKILGIEKLKNKSYKALSGGQQQRVLLARALCATENILILDEPVAGLDPVFTTELYQIIKQLNIQKNVTVIMVSHDVNAAVQYANKILHLSTCTEFFGSTSDYMKSKPGRRFLMDNEEMDSTILTGDNND